MQQISFWGKHQQFQSKQTSNAPKASPQAPPQAAPQNRTSSPQPQERRSQAQNRRMSYLNGGRTDTQTLFNRGKMLEMMKNNKERADLKKRADISESLEEEAGSVSSPMIKPRQLPTELTLESQRSQFLTLNNQQPRVPAFQRRMSNYIPPSSPTQENMLSVPGTPAGQTTAKGIAPGSLFPLRNESPNSNNQGYAPSVAPTSGSHLNVFRDGILGESAHRRGSHAGIKDLKELNLLRRRRRDSGGEQSKADDRKQSPNLKDEMFSLRKTSTLMQNSEASGPVIADVAPVSSVQIPGSSSKDESPTSKNKSMIGFKMPRMSLQNSGKNMDEHESRESATPAPGTPIHHPVWQYGRSNSQTHQEGRRSSAAVSAMDWIKDGLGKLFKKDESDLPVEDEQQKQRNIKKLYNKVQRGIKRKFLVVKNAIKERAENAEQDKDQPTEKPSETVLGLPPDSLDTSMVSKPQSLTSGLSIKSILQAKKCAMKSVASIQKGSAFKKSKDSLSDSSSKLSKSVSSHSSGDLFQNDRQSSVVEIKQRIQGETIEDPENFDIMKEEAKLGFSHSDTFYSQKSMARQHTLYQEPTAERGVGESEINFAKRVRAMEQEQKELLLQKKMKVLKQNHPWRVRWDLFVMVLSVWNSVTIPVDIAFEPDSFKSKTLLGINYTTDLFFFFDIIFNFRTSFHDAKTGDEVMDPKEIAFNYVFAGRFWIDLLSTIPFDLLTGNIDSKETTSTLQLFSMLKLFRVLRLSKIIQYMNSTDDVKLSLRLFKLFFFLVLYIHCTACLFFYVAKQDESWMPAQFTYNSFELTLYDSEIYVQYAVSCYNSILALTGNEIYPANMYQFTLASLLLVCGALINANIFGTIAVIAQTFNRKAQRFQEQIDVANTSMKNMKLPEALQNCVREFMLSTQSNLDNQKELDLFLNMISPSLRQQVTQHIFSNAISANSIFSGNQELVEFLINDIVTLLFLPEDTIVQQNQSGENLFLIAKGDCEVWVKDHMKSSRYVKQLQQGEYFGELALITQQSRSATVKSSNYCTMASLSSAVFYDLCNTFPDIFIKMKQRALDYDDPWKRFQFKILKQIEYFDMQLYDDEFFDDIHYYLKEEHFEEGTEIIGTAEPCTSLLFVVQGLIELQIFDQDGGKYVLETLKQGDVIGQYSVLFNEGFLFTTVAKSSVRILSLDQSFFVEQKDEIDGLEDAIFQAEEFVKEFGIPICDFKVFTSCRDTIATKLRRSVRRAMALNKMQVKDRFLGLIKQIQKNIKKDKKENKKDEKAMKQLKMLTRKKSRADVSPACTKHQHTLSPDGLGPATSPNITSKDNSPSKTERSGSSPQNFKSALGKIMSPTKRKSILHLQPHPHFGMGMGDHAFKRENTMREKQHDYRDLIEKQTEQIAGLKDLLIQQQNTSGKARQISFKKLYKDDQPKQSARSMNSQYSRKNRLESIPSSCSEADQSSSCSDTGSFSKESFMTSISKKSKKEKKIRKPGGSRQGSKKYVLFDKQRQTERKIQIERLETTKKKEFMADPPEPPEPEGFLFMNKGGSFGESNDFITPQRGKSSKIQVLSERSESAEESSMEERRPRCIINSSDHRKGESAQRKSIVRKEVQFGRKKMRPSAMGQPKGLSANLKRQAQDRLKYERKNSRMLEAQRPSFSMSHKSKASSSRTKKTGRSKIETSSFGSDSSFVYSDEEEQPKFLSIEQMRKGIGTLGAPVKKGRNFVKQKTSRFMKKK